MKAFSAYVKIENIKTFKKKRRKLKIQKNEPFDKIGIAKGKNET